MRWVKMKKNVNEWRNFKEQITNLFYFLLFLYYLSFQLFPINSLAFFIASFFL